MTSQSVTLNQPGAPASRAARPVLQLDAVHKTYPAQPPVVALRGVSLTIRQGELVAIVGPSGSGKTTLLQVMGTLDRPTSGTVRFGGADASAMTDRELAGLRASRIGFVFQQFFLAEHATLLDNVADGLLYSGIPHRQRRALAAEALTAVHLGDRLRARPTQLSGGQRQRVAIARALIGRPAIVLADEPTGNLDLETGLEVLELLDRLTRRAGKTMIMVTHSPEVMGIADRVLTLDRGRLVERPAAGRGSPAA
jgi:putative ABC transport system ATP-binding protein